VDGALPMAGPIALHMPTAARADDKDCLKKAVGHGGEPNLG
jgi:hypothetical protein